MTSIRRELRCWAKVDACGRGRGQLHVDVYTQKLEPTDDILSSSHAKKLEILYQNFVFGWNKK